MIAAPLALNKDTKQYAKRAEIALGATLDLIEVGT
jgi:hypothetical protein